MSPSLLPRLQVSQLLVLLLLRLPFRMLPQLLLPVSYTHLTLPTTPYV